MKKFSLLLALALPMVIASCGDDNDATFSINQSNVTVDYQKKTTLTATEKNVVWGSTDEFVATVNDKGEVEGKHVGTTTITATKNGETASCKVTVLPTNNSFVMPYLTWKASASQIKSAFSGFQESSKSKEDLLIYYTNATTETLPGYIYRLNAANYNGLYQSQLLASPEDQVAIYNWMAQYYEEKSTDEDEDLLYYNGKDEFVAALGAVIDNETFKPLGWAAIWTAPDYTVTKGGNLIKEAKAVACDVLKN